MATQKRKAVTTDDLMRMQEGPRPKRPRRQDSKAILGAENFSGDDESGSEGADNDGSQDSESESADVVESDTVEKETLAGTSSRFTLKPRTQLGQNPSNGRPGKPGPPTFASLDISTSLQAALTKLAIRTPTEIQAACIPPLLAGRDCIGNAKTGSGKTIAFALPILQKLSVDPYGIFALVLTPTRELAFQISEQFAVLGAPLSVRTAVVVGGMDMMSQALELGNRPHVVVATPGRIVDLLKSCSGEWDLSRIRFLILDEADRLLTSTFAPELAYLFGVLPRDRQTCLFTATWTDAVEKVAQASPRAGKQKPFLHRMTASVETVETLEQHYILVPSHVRESYLYHLLCHPPESVAHLRRAPPEPMKSSRGKGKGRGKPKASQKKSISTEEEPEQPPPTIIFCNRSRTVAYLTHLLKTLSIRSTALHSRLTQRERLSSLSLFRACVVPVLVSTDVGARGLDIEDVTMVINWDLPVEPEEYTHRVGRTARAGKAGFAVSLVTERDEDSVLKIEDRINTKLTEIVLPEGKVLEKLNVVSTAKRLANMELHDSDFGKREEIHRIKGTKRGHVVVPAS
ncbi:hypothetical protein JAAARDRAFT_27907 [Jaapia argillacea MUCL 33604]|uniref:ATP-dependent RNA helicase DBP8 n=1 Tax=Jaapia argillacea MUCL 33604 TaxID=933084 RepID=A0A067QL78_9AGAM|nr:hypothetical protein JAAARDRAFT_27907 [Jaapia argillacea MUCL 33604]